MAPLTSALTPCPAATGLQISKRAAPASLLKCAMSKRTALRHSVMVRAERGGGGSFWSGFIVGGTIMGALGFVFAPQISKAILGDDQRLRLPRFLEDEQDPEVTKQNLADKIAQLNAAIDDVSSQLKANDTMPAKEEVSA